MALVVQLRDATRDETTSAARTTRASSPDARPHPVRRTAGILRGRWAAPILWSLFWGEKRFYQVLRELPGIGRKTLTFELEAFERRGIVERRLLGLGSLEVRYALTPAGETLKPVVGVMYEWGLLAERLGLVGDDFEKPSRAPLTEHRADMARITD